MSKSIWYKCEYRKQKLGQVHEIIISEYMEKNLGEHCSCKNMENTLAQRINSLWGTLLVVPKYWVVLRDITRGGEDFYCVGGHY